MDESDDRRETTDVSPTDEATVLIAAKVRDDSRTRGQVTRLDALVELLAGLELAALGIVLEAGVEDASVTADTVAETAEEEIVDSEDGDEHLAEMGEDSTDLEPVADEGAPVEPTGRAVEASTQGSMEPDDDQGHLDAARRSAMAKVAVSLTEMEAAEEYQDITSIYDSEGELYLYSERHVTGRYARILLQVQTDDASTLIADTVREDSKIYPRPTAIELLTEPPYSIDSDEIEALVRRTIESEEFEDIKRIVASTGAAYLYSELHMSEAWARSLVETIEVDYDENP